MKRKKEEEEEASWGPLGAYWGLPGSLLRASLGPLGGLLGPLGGHLTAEGMSYRNKRFLEHVIGYLESLAVPWVMCGDFQNDPTCWLIWTCSSWPRRC